MSNRQVFDKSMVAHLWANKSQDSARVSGGNFWFTGATLYSYGRHFVCAFHMPEEYNRNGRAVALFNDSRYSMTTGRHMDAAWRALPARIDRIDVPGLDENMTGYIARHGAADVVAALIERIRQTADKAANPRIRPDTRGALFNALRELRADATHLATCDATRRDLSAAQRKKARAQLVELSPDVDAFATEGDADKAGAAAYAFALNRLLYAESMDKNITAARDNLKHAFSNVECGNFSTVAEYVSRAERSAGIAREFADKAQKKIPAAFAREMKKIAHGSAWRADVNAKWNAERIAQARTDWSEGEAVARAALAECDFWAVTRALSGDFRRASEVLAHEPGADDRAAFIATLESTYKAWQAKGDAERAREQITAARELFAAGKFTSASDAARSARHKMLQANGAPGCAFTMEETEGAEKLAQDADARKAEEYAAQLADWRDGKPGARFPSALNTRNAGAFLRLSADGRRVETSQGAEVPARVCSLVWHLIGEQIAAGTSRTFSGVKLGSFELDSIDETGNVRAGCHFIPFSELADIAARLSFPSHK